MPDPSARAQPGATAPTLGAGALPAAAAPRRAAPSWRTLAALVVAVLLVHALVLREVPRHVGPQVDAAATQAFTTRRIELPPPTPPTPVPTPPRPAPAPKPPPRPSPPAKPTPAPTAATSPSALPVPAETTDTADAAPAEAAPPDSAAAATGDTVAAAAPAPTASAAVASGPTSPELPADPLPTPVDSMDLPVSVDLAFKMTGASRGMNYYADSNIIWRNAGNRYELRAGVSVLFIGARSMTSTGQLGPDGLAPTRFADKSRNEVAAHFEPDKGQITFSANTPPARWLKGAQDRISVFMQLSGMLAGNAAAFPPGSTITMYTVGPRSADTWTFQVEGEELLQLPIGETKALKLSRQPRRDYDQKVEIWFAPSLVYLPVRNRITQANGDFIDQQLTSIARPIGSEVAPPVAQ